MMESNFRDEELVKVQGRQYPIVGGRLRLAHEENKELSISTSIIDISDDRVVVQANITTDKGDFSGLGNASLKRDRQLSNALIELAETRAIARALRFAGYGVEFTGFEEVHDDYNASGQLPDESTTASKSQLEAIASLAKSRDITSRELHDIMFRLTGKSQSRELTAKDASDLMEELKKHGKHNKTRIS
jgi:hypothetical protein